jgi:hypothetical protein
VKKFPGRRSFRKGPFDVIEFALIADGVPTVEKLNALGLGQYAGLVQPAVPAIQGVA